MRSGVRARGRDLHVLVVFIALAACRETAPEHVYVPSPEYRQSLRIQIVGDSAQSLRAGAPLTLHAERRTGPWRLVARDSAMLTNCWWVRPPLAEEREVASSVTWRVDPADSVRFNLPQPPVMMREVRFARPGVYRLWAVSPGCPTRLFSDTLEFTIQP
jgi:hypothetical protein